MATTPDLDVVDQLDAAGALSAYTKGANLFYGKVRADAPDASIFCLASGGPAPIAYMSTTAEFRASQVQCRVRSAQHDFQGGQTTARAVRDAMHHLPPSGYIDAMALESEPLYLGEDDEGRHDWTINLELWHDQ